jgi:branched-chain amino acid aminotransferase
MSAILLKHSFHSALEVVLTSVQIQSSAAPPGPFGQPYRLVCVDGEVVEQAAAALSVHAHAVSYGTGTFEGIRAFWNDDVQELYLSEAIGHYARLHRSARMLGLAVEFSVDELLAMTRELLRRNDVRADAYLRPILLQSGAALPVRMHDVATRLSIAVTPLAGEYAASAGVRCMVSSWRRASDVTAPIRAKVIGSYVGPSLAKTEAVRAGYDEAIMLTLDGYVAEATTSNILMRFGDTWSTPPGTDDILEGITRAQVMSLLAEDTGRRVVERRIHRSELYAADEVLLCGTATTVVPVVEVDGRRVAEGTPRPTTLRLREDLWTIARRQDSRHPEWTTPVYQEA